YQLLNGRMEAPPNHKSQSRVSGTDSSFGNPSRAVGCVPGVVEMCASVTSPISPDHTISAATRLHSWEEPRFPLCVATLYFTATSCSRRDSHGVLVSGFSR